MLVSSFFKYGENREIYLTPLHLPSQLVTVRLTIKFQYWYENNDYAANQSVVLIAVITNQ